MKKKAKRPVKAARKGAAKAPKKRKARTRAVAGLDPVKTETGKHPKKPGRPTTFTKVLGERVCELVATTARGLDFICETNPDLPSSRTVHRWLNTHPEFCQSYARARELQADLIFDECLEIADDRSRDTKIVGRDGSEYEVPDTEWIQRSKVRIDTRLRMAGKLSPKKYGEKLEVDLPPATTKVLLPVPVPIPAQE